MAEVEVRQEPPRNGGGGGVGWVLALVVLVLVLLLAWFFFAGGGGEEAPSTDVDVEVPQADAPTIEVPDEIDVNVGRDGGGNPPSP